jgi:hypothetical protein
MVGLSAQIVADLQVAAPEGLQRVADRRWVSEPHDGIRRILEFQALKGAQYSARWGLSVDFVPNLQGARLSWKRTAKTAMFDLCIDPIDVEGHVPNWCALTADTRDGAMKKIVRAVREQASRDFARINTLHDLRELFQLRAAMRFRRFGPKNYVQTDLAWGLVEMATGDQEGGAKRIAAFCDRFGVPPETPILVKAKREALQHVGDEAPAVPSD